VTELRERAKPATRDPWPAGAYVLVGTSGKRAHWDGDDWHGGESDLEPTDTVLPDENADQVDGDELVDRLDDEDDADR
jgi:hypothetical protein